MKHRAIRQWASIAVPAVVAATLLVLPGGQSTNVPEQVSTQRADQMTPRFGHHGHHGGHGRQPGHHHASARELAFRNDMRKLWEDHVTWTRLAIVSFAADLPDFNATAERLLRNQADIGDAFAPYYGRDAADQLTALLRDHILIAVDVLIAAKAGDQDAVADAQTRWQANADDIAVLLHDLNPRSWRRDDIRAMMGHHLALTTEEAVAQLTGDFAASIAAYDAIHRQILGMADELSTGIIRQFPHRFRSRWW